MAIAPDGRIFVCEQIGTLRVIKNGTVLPTPFMTLVVDPDGEHGLLGVAFDPNFASKHFLYIYYTVAIDRDITPPVASPQTAMSSFREAKRFCSS